MVKTDMNWRGIFRKYKKQFVIIDVILDGAWKISTDTGGQKGGVPLDLVVTFIGSEGESELCPLKSSRDNPFQIGQKDMCEVLLYLYI